MSIADESAGIGAATKKIVAERDSHLDELTSIFNHYVDRWEELARRELAEAGVKCSGLQFGPEAPHESFAPQDYPEIPAAELLVSILATKNAVSLGRSEVAALSALGIATALLKMGKTGLVEVAISMMQRKYSKGRKRRPKLPTKRVIRCAIKEGHKTAAEVQSYLETNAEACDQWGLMAITNAGDWFTVEDLDGPKNQDGEYPEGKVYKDRLTVLVSQVKNEK